MSKDYTYIPPNGHASGTIMERVRDLNRQAEQLAGALDLLRVVVCGDGEGHPHPDHTQAMDTLGNRLDVLKASLDRIATSVEALQQRIGGSEPVAPQSMTDSILR